MKQMALQSPAPSAAAGAVMSVRAVHAGYATGDGRALTAVDGVSLELARGEVLGVAGESGCGKSTLAAVVSLSVRHPLQVMSGEMTIAGRTVVLADQARLPRSWRGGVVALLPQGAMNSLNPTARVREFAVDVIRAHEPSTSRADAVERARSRLEQVSLPARVLDSYPHQLSGGMRQRVVTVISTLLNPMVLVADEPTSALDVSSQRALVALLRDLMESRCIGSVLFIAHDLPLLGGIADRIAVMYAGRIVEMGASQDVIHRPQHPYSRGLVDSIVVPELKLRHRRIDGIAGAPPDLRTPPGGCRFHPRCPVAMPICGCEEPPEVVAEQHYAACWRLLDQPARDGSAGAIR